VTSGVQKGVKCSPNLSGFFLYGKDVFVESQSSVYSYSQVFYLLAPGNWLVVYVELF